MCGGVRYTDTAGKTWTVYFPSPKAALPVLKKSGEVEWVVWGRRKEEPSDPFPQGGWARLDSIQSDKWDRFAPRPVLVPIEAFMEKDAQRASHWIEIPHNSAIQGLIANAVGSTRIYVVTTSTPAEYAWVHDRWPRIVTRAAVPLMAE